MIKCHRSYSIPGAVVLTAVFLAACGAGGGGDKDGSRPTSKTTVAPVTTATTVPAAPTAAVPPTAAPTTAAPTTAPPTTAPPTTAPPTTAVPPTTAPPLPLPGSEAVAACGPPAGTWTVTTYKTARFTVHICESTVDGTLYYRGRNRENGDRIDLPANYADLGIYADNGEFQYYINGDALRVFKGDEQILEEPVLSVS